MSLPLLLANCATGIRPLDSSAVVSLGSNEGFLILHVDTDVAIAGIELNGETIASGIAVGHHVWLVRAIAGSYRFTALQFINLPGHQRRERSDTNENIRFRSTGRIKRHQKLYLTSDDEFRFEVERGSVNYGGALVVRGTRERIDVSSRNHVAMAIRMLSDRDAELVASHPLRFGRLSEDGFLDYYSRERSAVLEGKR